jgi:hypothetical protein
LRNRCLYKEKVDAYAERASSKTHFVAGVAAMKLFWFFPPVDYGCFQSDGWLYFSR